MAAIKLRHRTYWAKLRVPKELREAYGGKQYLETNLRTGDAHEAHELAAIWEGQMRQEFRAKAGRTPAEPDNLRQLYDELKRRAVEGEFQVETGPDFLRDTGEVLESDPVEAGIDYKLEEIAEATAGREWTPREAAAVAALNDARMLLAGKRPKNRPEYEPGFSEVSQEYMRLWKASKAGTKETNTEQQKLATFALFKGFWNDKPMRGIGGPDAAAFHDTVRLFDPNWARSPAAKKMSWDELLTTYGRRPKGLSDGTMNRHMATLASLWDWARKRGHCQGDNPFAGFHRKLRQGVNVSGYVAWETEELEKLLHPGPKRRDLLEVMLVGMFSGMRLDEIASLTWGQLKSEGAGASTIHYVQVVDAKTPAGNRQVPLHPALPWLTTRKRGADSARIWSTFNPEGPGKKPGADAGKEFSRFKAARGFTARQKAFHSFRKNVTRIMERAGVPENEWAQVFGHERDFTYRVYNPDGIALARKAEIIRLIAYPGLELPVID